MRIFICIAVMVFVLKPLFAQDDFELLAVHEMENSMAAGLFSSSDPATVKKYMPDGKVPSTITSYVLKIGNEFILIDAGLGTPAWTEGIEKLGVDPARVKTFLVTHMHGDHIGGLLDGEKRRFPNASVLVSKPEYAFWYDRREMSKTPQCEKIKSTYGDGITSKTFDYGAVVFSGGGVKVTAVDAHGHTPGHTVFLVESPKKKILIIGDLLHAAALQFPAPQCNTSYDVAPADAAEARCRILDMAAEQNLPIAGMHLPKPSVGTVKKDGKGGYVFTAEKP